MRDAMPAHLRFGPTMDERAAADPVCVVVQQPALPAYRVPVFEALSKLRGIELTVYYGDDALAPANAEVSSGWAVFSPLKQVQIFGRPLRWHSVQWRAATRRSCDVLILLWNLNFLSLVPALVRARLAGVPLILWGHGYSKCEAAWRAWSRRQVARLADAVLFYDHVTAERYARSGFDTRRIFVAQNALDQRAIRSARAEWLAQPARLEAFRVEHGLVPARTLLYVSRLEHANRVDLLLRAAARLAARHADLKVVIVGDGAARLNLAGLAEALNIKDRVIMPGAIYEERALAPWFLSAAMFCYPANVGLSLLHAFGYGLPVVTSDRRPAHNPEIHALEAGVNGELFEDGNAESLAAVLDALLADDSRRRRLGEAARRTVESEHSMETMLRGFREAIAFCAPAGSATE